MFKLQAAIIAARVRTGDKHIGMQVARGLIDVVRAVPPANGRGKYAVTVLRAGLTQEQAISHLNAM